MFLVNIYLETTQLGSNPMKAVIRAAQSEWAGEGVSYKFSGFDFECKKENGASLVAQWLRICLPMQGTRVRALVWEDPTCRGATRPVSHNY